MGRLFWKFFFAFWLALLIAGISVGTVVWLRHSTESNDDTILDQHAGKFIQAAADVARIGGTLTLKQFLSDLDRSPLPTIYAVDKHNHDLLNRAVPSPLIDLARQQLLNNNKNSAVENVISKDGEQFILFARLPLHPALPMMISSFDNPPPPQPENRTNPGMESPPVNDMAQHRPTHFEYGHPPPPHPFPVVILIGSGLLAAVLFSILLAWYFTKPIKILRKAFAAVAKGELKTRVGSEMGSGHDELAELGRNFDHMATQIESLLCAQRRLLHDVSHELRSPLARMQAAIGLAQQQPEKTDLTLQRIERESKRIDELVGQLLILSRLETGTTQNHYQNIELNDVLSEVVEDARFEAANKQVTIDYQQNQELIVNGEPELLHRAIENVLRNAIRFSPEKGLIKVEMSIDPYHDAIIIAINDQGSGVPPQDLKNIFEPFYRSQSGERNKGVGLGLAIALRAIDTHGGSINARNRSQGGLHVEIRLPRLK